MQDGLERPIVSVSHSLTEIEQKYSQIKREALACVFKVMRFHNYLFAKCFTLQTNHKPLISHKAVSSQAWSRIPRWALTLAMNEYVISLKPTASNGNTDAMSRWLLSDQPSSTPSPAKIVRFGGRPTGSDSHTCRFRAGLDEIRSCQKSGN